MKCCNSKKVIDDLYKNIAINDRLRDSDNSKEIEKCFKFRLYFRRYRKWCKSWFGLWESYSKCKFKKW